MSAIDESPSALRPCASCGCHHRAADTACPHCGRATTRSALGSGAVLLGLAVGLQGCFLSQEMYGVAITDDPVPVETAETGDTSDTSDTGAR